MSIRLTEATERLVEAEARRTRRSRSAVVEAFTEETARVRRFPGIAFRGDDARRRAWVVGSGLDVWEIAEMVEDSGSVDDPVEGTHVTEAQVRLALAYRRAYPEEIDELVAENRSALDDLTVLYPFVEVAGSIPEA